MMTGAKTSAIDPSPHGSGAVIERTLREADRRPLVVMVLDSDAIYRTGLVTCLTSVGDVGSVHEVRMVEEALRHPALRDCDVILIDNDYADGDDAIRRIQERTPARLVMFSSRCEQENVLSCVQAGAAGYLAKQTLTPDVLAVAVRDTARGGGVVAPELLAGLLEGIARVSRDVLEPRGLTLSRLTTREQQVLEKIADGLGTREVAAELCYSERTVKNILHDVVTKLNARTRSQAVARAVRQGLI